jgi:hypothetical protein
MKMVRNQVPVTDLEREAELLEDEVIEMLEGDV